ncbi:uncharacterized protein K460DRAFT_390421 [Cucurbitaria berberidis CBS 394.84]|uniref:Rhodopsin domain-containing protein n=1 Tax=Cucurbitaria berberidis CBS 394.84 TaxID=1168544 RepID=A0A9P4LC81_9PLEO|nr:uncharacterized protein K460DRAFT_390421 [Cucurbitaria berberidis CBS 394.84]KAF1849755.1 hypothetical protein K460DRAFT_390421 [Cucurbitaria berberidis CBS 394.84]
MSSFQELIMSVILNPPDENEPLPLSNRKATILGTTITFLIASWIAVLFRLWVRFRIVREPGLDDAFILLAAMTNTVASTCVCLSVYHGLGQHMLYLGIPKMEGFLVLFYIEHNVYITETALIKVSLLLQYFRIFKAGIMRKICIGLLVLVSLWGLGFSIVGWFPCFPVRGFWQRTIGAKCYGFGFGNVQSFIAMFKAHSASNMVLDFIIFLTPLVLFRTPHLRVKNVLAMTGVFAFGAIVVSTSVWRLYSIVAHRAATYPYLDITWFSPTMVILTCIEINLALICASMPIFWPVIEKSFASILVSYELEIVEERVDDHGLAYELEHMRDREGSVKSSATSTRELTQHDDEDGDMARKVYTVGLDPLSEKARTTGLVTDVRSKPKPKWEL